MNNILLGKTVKAMYKLSGKTLTQLADETELTVDTINNFFYARLQKPSFTGVCALVNATGYSVSLLDAFMSYAAALPQDADITEEFAKFVTYTKEGTPSAEAAKETQVPAEAARPAESKCPNMNAFTEQFEKELERIQQAYRHYEEQQTLYTAGRVSQMEESYTRMKEHYDHSVGEVKKAHEKELERMYAEIRSVRKINLLLVCTAIAAIAASAVIAIVL